MCRGHDTKFRPQDSTRIFSIGWVSTLDVRALTCVSPFSPAGGQDSIPTTAKVDVAGSHTSTSVNTTTSVGPLSSGNGATWDVLGTCTGEPRPESDLDSQMCHIRLTAGDAYLVCATFHQKRTLRSSKATHPQPASVFDVLVIGV